ncbi:cold-shock' DNA-binding domain-containing protein [Phascolomyces articulosus]|uniref:Cold-shock' DNA-binding domain-containing protein n=1 Tax=Phascolomyces articulosus TaxID=60185 RepID=A0AAD5K2Z4_9FUNG|nr:cold-shock' DNA-binding domain-containing protein [Phascolomyces articulosus]
MASVATNTTSTVTTTTTPGGPLRKLGHVKFFNSTKGYGFIIPAEQLVETVAGQPPVEVFVHHTAITGGGFKSLAEGEEVEYDLIQGPKGMQAANVSGPGGRPVQGDPNAHRPYHHRYQKNKEGEGECGEGESGGGHHHHNHHHQQQHHQHHHHQQQQHHHYGSGGGNMPEGMNNGHLGYTVYGMPYGYHPIYPAGPYMVPANGYYHHQPHHHQFASSQSSPQLKPSIAMYYPYPPAGTAVPPPPTTATTPSQQPSYGLLSNSSSSSSSNHTATTCEPENGEASTASPSC